MIKKWFCFQSPLLSGVLCLYCMEANRIKTQSYSDSHNTHWNISAWENRPASLCPLHTCANLLRKPAKVCMCTKTSKNFSKTQNALESLKFELLSLWCLNFKLEYLWVLILPGTKKGFLVQISFSVLDIKIKGDLGEKSSTKKPSSSLAVSVQWVSSQNSEYSAFLHLQF